MNRNRKNLFKALPIITVVLVSLLNIQSAFSQCGKQLVEQAVAEIGDDAIYMRHFEVSFNRPRMNRPQKVAKFNTLLTSGKRYRFTIKNPDNHSGQAILQLRYKGNILDGTGKRATAIAPKMFEFDCNEDGYYQVLISFEDGKPGCAVGIQSIILSEGKKTYEKKASAPAKKEVLYTGVENPLNIKATGVPDGKLEVSIDKGKIIKKDGVYRAVVNEPGAATVKVVAKDVSGEVKEEGTAEFLVEKPPLPQISLAGIGSGLVNKELLLNNGSVELFYPVYIEGITYDIVNFSLRKNHSFQSYTTTGNRLSQEQKRFIEELSRGERLIVHDIILKDNHGNTINIEPAEFIIE